MGDFDWRIYRELNTDLVKANLNTEKQVVDHWNKYGKYENRASRVTQITKDFVWGDYLSLNPDLVNAGIKTKFDAEIHWIRHGKQEKRNYKKKSIEPFIVKNYDGNFLSGYIMFSLHEELINMIGVHDTIFSGCENMYTYFMGKYERIPDGIVFLWNFTKEMYDKIKSQMPRTKIILWTDDLHWYNKDTYNKNYFSYSRADIYVSHYNFYKLFYNIDAENKLINLNHSCSSHFYKNDININSIDKIYMYGATDPNNYKLRTWFCGKMIPKHSENFILKKHPGYGGNKYNDSLKTAEELYQYSYSFTSGLFPKFEIPEPQNARYYLIGKFFEIIGSGVLLLCNDYGVKEEFNKLGFYNMLHYVNINDANFDETIKWLFDPINKSKIMEIRINGHNQIKEKHTVLKRLEYVNSEIIKKIKL